MKKWTMLILILFIMSCTKATASVRRTVKDGNELFNEKKYEEALENYTKAQVASPDDPRILHNIGITEYAAGKYTESLPMLEKALSNESLTVLEKSKAAYNLGNTYFKTGDFEKSVKAYKQAIDLDQSNIDARFNLMAAQIKLEEQKKQQQQDNDQNKDNKDDQKKGGQDKRSQSKEENGPAQENQSEQGQSGDSESLTEEEASRLLDMLAGEEEIPPFKPEHTAKGKLSVEKDW